MSSSDMQSTDRPAVDGAPSPPTGEHPVLIRAARALYDREAYRDGITAEVISRINGQPPRPMMEPFEECLDGWLGDARAVLEAIREPTADMVDASRLCTIRNSRPADPAHPFESPITAMIDAVLAVGVGLGPTSTAEGPTGERLNPKSPDQPQAQHEGGER